ncbi:siderophore-interacting protein [Microvirga rosea]|uniref:siderophore-interacting protein n=1 Tax=Microvirga rosea TaxID=2715425 RepID=UPI002222C634|nr:siderophore-interacting protein [Microvirga rosea]
MRTADCYAFLGDETAVPAVARMLENLPSNARGIAVLEVDNVGEEQGLIARPGIHVRWLHRNGAEAGTTTLLQDAFSTLIWPDHDVQLYLWPGWNTLRSRPFG